MRLPVIAAVLLLGAVILPANDCRAYADEEDSLDAFEEAKLLRAASETSEHETNAAENEWLDDMRDEEEYAEQIRASEDESIEASLNADADGDEAELDEDDERVEEIISLIQEGDQDDDEDQDDDDEADEDDDAYSKSAQLAESASQVLNNGEANKWFWSRRRRRTVVVKPRPRPTEAPKDPQPMGNIVPKAGRITARIVVRTMHGSRTHAGYGGWRGGHVVSTRRRRRRRRWG
ncbi:glutamic acid-rich protein-like [Sycon ciliatum]|uniref:glutamic acid-rich protein-like n=1 Tax=Sycon ciliatum TaxID=27933 RepID=UPI0031F65002